jgi:hypothetical protein
VIFVILISFAKVYLAYSDWGSSTLKPVKYSKSQRIHSANKCTSSWSIPSHVVYIEGKTWD